MFIAFAPLTNFQNEQQKHKKGPPGCENNNSHHRTTKLLLLPICQSLNAAICYTCSVCVSTHACSCVQHIIGEVTTFLPPHTSLGIERLQLQSRRTFFTLFVDVQAAEGRNTAHKLIHRAKPICLCANMSKSVVVKQIDRC